MKTTLLLMIYFGLYFSLYSQNCIVTVLDEKTKDPIQGVRIVTWDKDELERRKNGYEYYLPSDRFGKTRALISSFYGGYNYLNIHTKLEYITCKIYMDGRFITELEGKEYTEEITWFGSIDNGKWESPKMTIYLKKKSTNYRGQSNRQSQQSNETNIYESNSNGSNCPQTVYYEGKNYNTVQIGSQCWLKENLDIGTMIQGSQEQTNNGVIEKNCYNNDLRNCEKYGGLYQWAEAVQYKNGATNSNSPNPLFTSNVQGICPNGFHIPTKEEFLTLTEMFNKNGNSLIAIGQGPGDAVITNSSGFSALLSGVKWETQFGNLSTSSFFWSSYAYNRLNSFALWLDSNKHPFGYKIEHSPINEENLVYKGFGGSIRCIKN